ncbi:MAG: DUF507 family protein [Cryobacterium sp.]|nr:DUF507 family protein [Oligoflexia bacterium]
MTRKENVKVLCKSIVTRLENNKSIAFPPRLRSVVGDEVYGLISPYIMTDEDLREKALVKMGQSMEKLAETNFTESEAFKTVKKMIREGFGDDELNGFYFLKPLKSISGMIVSYLMRSHSIDEVYETDEDLEKMIVEIVKTFNPEHAH